MGQREVVPDEVVLHREGRQRSDAVGGERREKHEQNEIPGEARRRHHPSHRLRRLRRRRRCRRCPLLNLSLASDLLSANLMQENRLEAHA